MHAIDAERLSSTPGRGAPGAGLPLRARLRAAHTGYYAAAFAVLLAIKLSGVLSAPSARTVQPLADDASLALVGGHTR